MDKYTWDRLNNFQLGKYWEYYVKMEFTLFGFDVYTSEVDDHGIDFVVRKDEATYYDIQAKAVRYLNYIYFSKDKFTLRKNLLAAIGLFSEGSAPQLYLIPSIAWQESSKLLVNREYEWGINLSKRNLTILSQFGFDKMIKTL